MRFIKSVINAADRYLSRVTMLLGASVIVLAFFVSPIPLQVALGLTGAGVVTIGLGQQKRLRDAEKIDRILTELNEIRQKLEQPKEPETGRTAIADVITAGLKLYADRITKPTQEKE
ncbi:MAG: hypothetical protein IIB13_07380 [Chloroflexi bacterium]|nr:hypothetical protein [Chloroflexota bacterium]